ncbi:MAG: tyrosine-type recombinase/integrase [Acidimicrobiales bacterium]
MTELRAAAREYLALRRSFGFKLVEAGRLLDQFVDYLEARGAQTVTAALALEWATAPAGADPWWWRGRLSVARCFARYLSAFDPATEIPPTQLLPVRPPRAVPYVYCEADVVALIEEAGRLSPPLRAATYSTFIGLVAVTGMRGGEAVALDDSDVDLAEGVITVRQAKFGKSRELVLHSSTVRVLADYRGTRRRLCPRPNSTAFFLSTKAKRLHYSNVDALFRRLAQEVGLPRPGAPGRARIHDLRHSFAVNTVVGWYAEGIDVGARLADLCTYLGHANPSDTYWYLTATPELLQQAVQRLEASSEVRP